MFYSELSISRRGTMIGLTCIIGEGPASASVDIYPTWSWSTIDRRASTVKGMPPADGAESDSPQAYKQAATHV